MKIIIITDEEMCNNKLDRKRKFASFAGYLDRKAGFKIRYLYEERDELMMETQFYVDKYEALD